jgi:phage protein U
MLAALGMFVFDTDSLLFDALARRRGWRHGRTDRFEARAASQFLGPGEDRITLSGTLVPELAGRFSSIETLAEMADSGDAHLLADGSGNQLGSFTIESLEEQHSNLIDNGRARVIGFTIELLRTQD